MALFRHEAREETPERLFLQPVEDDGLSGEAWDGEDDFADDADYQAELKAQRDDQFRAAAGLGDFLGVMLGLAAVLALVALLLSLYSWVRRDLLETFSLLQHL